ncbi:HEAT repeat domain-containing protein [Aquisphaera insulae]|uniref:HEAT repeat domain-containing protein n=1 Tax=Aquisphaera insulae TaxID=2712864 RepID=UPI0013EAB7EA|nr:HEAT repeat domain-containing protein [Aquisphaera insulae]
MTLHPGPLAAAVVGLLAATVASRADPPTRDTATVIAAEQLRHGDLATRMDALQRISRMGSRGVPIVPELIHALGDGEPRVRAAAARILGGLGREATTAAATLIGKLSDPEPAVRLAAAWALVRVPSDPERLVPAVVAASDQPGGFYALAVELLSGAGVRAVPAAIEMLGSRQPERVVLGARILQRVGECEGPAAVPLLAAARGAERGVRMEIAAALAKVGRPGLTVIVKALRDPDPRVRGTAARAMAILSFRAAEGIPALIEALVEPGTCDDPNTPDQRSLDDDDDGSNPILGYHAALVSIGPDALRALVARLEHPRREERVAAIRAIAAFRQTAEPAVPGLVRMLARPGLRAEAAEALGWIGFPAHGSAPMLITFLKNRDPELRSSAARAIGRMNLNGTPAVRDAIKGLTGAARDADPGVRFAAAWSLAQISSMQFAELIPLVQDPEAKIRCFALEMLANRPNHDEALRAQLVSAMRDPAPRVRRAAAVAVNPADTGYEGIAMALLSLLADPDADVRAEAALNLAVVHGEQTIRIAPDRSIRGAAPPNALARSAGAGRILRAALEDPDRRVRVAAAHALTALPGEAAETVPALIQRLRVDPAPLIRDAAAQVLGGFETDATAALPALLDALGDPTGGMEFAPFITISAARSIRAIRRKEAPEITDRLIELLGDPRPVVREAARLALNQEVSVSLERLCHRLTLPETSLALRAAIATALSSHRQVLPALRRGGPVPVQGPGATDTASQWRASLEEARPFIERIAFDVEADEAVRRSALELAVALSTDPHHQGRLALEVLGRSRLGTVDRSVSGVALPKDVDALIAGMDDPDQQVRTVAAFASWIPLANEPVGNDPAAPRNRLLAALTRALDDADEQVRWAAATTLGTKQRRPGRPPDPVDPETVRKLKDMLRDRAARLRPGDWYLDMHTFQGMATTRVVAGDRGPRLRIAAARALGSLSTGDEETVRELVAAMEEETGFARWTVIRCLGHFGPVARSVVTPLLAVVERRSECSSRDELADRHLAIQALGQIGGPARDALPALIRALDEPDPLICNVAAQALVKVAPDDPTTATALTRAMHDRYRYYLADVARKALEGMGSPAVPILIEELTSIEPKDRSAAAASLGSMGDMARPALPHLKKLAESASFDLRQLATSSIQQIEAAAKRPKPADADVEEELERITVPGSIP